MRGKDILFSINGTAIACAEECDINFTTSFLNARVDPIADGSKPATIGFNITISGPLQFTDRKYLYNLLTGFQKVDFSYYTATASEGKFSGSCWVESWGEAAPTASFVRYNSSFLGEGMPSFEPEA